MFGLKPKVSLLLSYCSFNLYPPQSYGLLRKPTTFAKRFWRFLQLPPPNLTFIKCKTVFIGGRKAVFIESSYCALEGFLAHAEAFADVVGVAVVAVGKVVGRHIAEFFEELVGEVAEASFADALEREVEFAVGTNVYNGGVVDVAGVRLGLEYLVVVDESRAAVVGDDFEAKGRFLLYDDFHFLSAMVFAGLCRLEIAFHFG